MTFRAVQSLLSANSIVRPLHIPARRQRGKKGDGLRYERVLADSIPQAIHGPWFHYVDANGPGYCQPDFLYPLGPKTLLVLETKLSWSPQAHLQLSQLYLPVVSKAYNITAIGAVVCRNLSPVMPSEVAIFPTIEGLTDHLQFLHFPDHKLFVVHWLPIKPRRAPPSTIRQHRTQELTC